MAHAFLKSATFDAPSIAGFELRGNSAQCVAEEPFSLFLADTTQPAAFDAHRSHGSHGSHHSHHSHHSSHG